MAGDADYGNGGPKRSLVSRAASAIMYTSALKSGSSAVKHSNDTIKAHHVFSRQTESFTVSRDSKTGAVTGYHLSEETKSRGFATWKSTDTVKYGEDGRTTRIEKQREGFFKSSTTIHDGNKTTHIKKSLLHTNTTEATRAFDSKGKLSAFDYSSNKRTNFIGNNVQTRVSRIGSVEYKTTVNRFNDSAPVRAGRMIADKTRQTAKNIKNTAINTANTVAKNAARARAALKANPKRAIKTAAKATVKHTMKAGVKLTGKTLKLTSKLAPKTLRVAGVATAGYLAGGVKKLLKSGQDQEGAEAMKGADKITGAAKAGAIGTYRNFTPKGRKRRLKKKAGKIKKRQNKLVKKNSKTLKKIKKTNAKLKKGNLSAKKQARLVKRQRRRGFRFKRRNNKILKKNTKLLKIAKKLKSLGSIFGGLLGALGAIVIPVIIAMMTLMMLDIFQSYKTEEDHERIPFFKEEWYDEDFEDADDHEYDTYLTYEILSGMELDTKQISAIMGCMMYAVNGDFEINEKNVKEGIKSNKVNRDGEIETICRWRGDRKDRMMAYIAEAEVDGENTEPLWMDITCQLDVFEKEFSGEQGFGVRQWSRLGRSRFKKATTIEDCVGIFASEFMDIPMAEGMETYEEGYSTQIELAKACWQEIMGFAYPSPSISLPGEAYVIWQFLSDKGLPDEQIAGILGNFAAESGYQTIESINHTRTEDITAEGIGLAQWSYDRKTNLLHYASTHGKDWMDLGLQLEFLWGELDGTSVWGDAKKPPEISSSEGRRLFMKAETPEDAAYYFMRCWERPAGWDTKKSRDTRETLAREAYEMMQVKYSWPLPPNETTVTSWYTEVGGPHKYPHNGTDLGAPGGTPIYSVAEGVVRYAGNHSDRGSYVVVDHGDFQTLYQHMQYESYAAYGIKTGVHVHAGQTIGRVGTTGFSDGNHLHIELLFKSKSEYWTNPSADCPSNQVDAVLYLKDFTKHDPIINGSDYWTPSGF